MTAADWDREPTSDAERARWRVAERRMPDGSMAPGLSRVIETDEPEPAYVGVLSTGGLAAEAVWAHNVMHAAREKRALGMETLLRGHAEGQAMLRGFIGEAP